MNDVLFTTSDGVDIKMGDGYFYFIKGSMKPYRVTIKSCQDHSPAKGFIQFSTESAALKYKNEICHVD